MKEQKNKKITILYVLKILKEGSDKNHPILQSTITRTINALGISCDRKTVARDIDCLIKFGFDIKKYVGGGCFFDSNEFSQQDIETLVNAIDNLNTLPSKEEEELKSKVKKLVNINQR